MNEIERRILEAERRWDAEGERNKVAAREFVIHEQECHAGREREDQADDEHPAEVLIRHFRPCHSNE